MFDGHDMIFVSLEGWDEMWRRNQFICDELMRRHPEMKLLFVGPSRDLSAGLRRWDWGLIEKSRGESIPGYPNLTYVEPLKILPKSLWLGRVVNNWLARRFVRRAAKAAGLGRSILWLNPNEADHMAGRMGEVASVYDITDDWAKMSGRPGFTKVIVEQDRRLCEKVDAVIVCSEDLYASKRGLASNLHLVANGVHVEHYAGVLDGVEAVREIGGRALRSPVLGYTGTIHPDRVDLGLVEELAKQNPDFTLVLIGPNHFEKVDLERVEGIGNVLFQGPVPYDAIPKYMAGFDVCMVPHLVTDFTESLNPIKLWEYLAAGKPIVSTDVAGFRDFPEHVRIAEGAEAFGAAVRASLDEDAEVGESRRAVASSHSWASRVDSIENIIGECLRVDEAD